jgi:hypothetical protein
MKFTVIALLAFVAAVCAGPTSISDNNIGDIVTVGIKADIDISNKVEQTLVNVILAYLNQQGIFVRGPDGEQDPRPLPAAEESPIDNFSKMFLKN